VVAEADDTTDAESARTAQQRIRMFLSSVCQVATGFASGRPAPIVNPVPLAVTPEIPIGTAHENTGRFFPGMIPNRT
jgi:hypothetical protein